MKIRKAVITAAGRGVRLYPATDTVQKGMLPLVDRDGLAKPTIQIIAEEALDSGIEEICVVCAPGDEVQYRQQFKRLRKNLLEAYAEVEWAQDQAERIDNLDKRISFVQQEEALGYGHAVYCAQSFVGDEPFLLLLGDHVYLSNTAGMRCAEQVIRVAQEEECAVAAVHATREHLIGHYGTLCGKREHDRPGTYQIEKILEKPSLSLAELELLTPGLRTGFYLCFFGMHVLSPTIFEILGRTLANEDRTEKAVQLTPALDELARHEKYLALEVQGTRYDTGAKLGLLQAQIALAMAGTDREELLTTIAGQLADAHLQRDDAHA